ncbi:hypothetical protein Tco_1546033 [Tanacetum coccineum]
MRSKLYISLQLLLHKPELVIGDLHPPSGLRRYLSSFALINAQLSLDSSVKLLPSLGRLRSLRILQAVYVLLLRSSDRSACHWELQHSVGCGRDCFLILLIPLAFLCIPVVSESILQLNVHPCVLRGVNLWCGWCRRLNVLSGALGSDGVSQMWKIFQCQCLHVSSDMCFAMETRSILFSSFSVSDACVLCGLGGEAPMLELCMVLAVDGLRSLAVRGKLWMCRSSLLGVDIAYRAFCALLPNPCGSTMRPLFSEFLL